jgi:hypothetical protein
VNPVRKQQTTGLDWAFWFQWIMVTTVGWILAGALFSGIAFFAAGFTVGTLQWFVLQYRIARAWRWILASVSGWAAGALFAFFFTQGGVDFQSSLIIGLATGTAQWLVLREELHWAGWWIPINVVAWTTGLALLPGLLSTGALAGAVTGIALMLLLPYPKVGERVSQ